MKTIRIPIIVLTSIFLLTIGCSDAVSPDYLAPQVEWLFPEDNDALSNIIELQILAYDNDRVDSVAVYLNGLSPEAWRSGNISDSL